MQVLEAFEKFTNYMIAKGSKPRSVRDYKRRLHTFLFGYGSEDRLQQMSTLPATIDDKAIQQLVDGHGSRPLAEISPEDIDNWFAVMEHQHTKWVESGADRPQEQGELSVVTINGRRQAMKTFFSFCVHRRYLPDSPASHIQKRRLTGERHHLRKRMMRKADLFKMLDVASIRKRDHAQPRDFALLLFVAETAARPGEVANLKLADLELDKYEAHLNGKTGHRTVFFSNHTAKALHDYLEFRSIIMRAWQREHDYVFVNLSPRQMGKTIQAQTLYGIFKKIAKEVGVSGVFSPYSLRHMVATHLAMRAPLPLVQEQMGHSDISTTMIYVHPDHEKVKGMVAMHSPINEFVTEEAYSR